ncbi:outer dense fiber protein 2-like isoform X2 [Haliotis rufescens]|uniref:outer dense fiber protein 2-like isoform X2 n=1 Tax=Haliotis rufescens TaxID=6454 RepID=UPI001EB03A0C|nr:outer dense fiber protein 2-like isoform X2 [Haliotis rufescens]
MPKGRMGVEKGLRPTSPVHVHVEDDTPVHVHVKKATKKKGTKVRARQGFSSSLGVQNLRIKPRKSTTASARARSRSPGGGPWVPPPGKATKGSKISWQGPTHRLEITTPRTEVQIEDLSTDDEDRVHGNLRNYEKKIDSLMTEVGTLKNEAALQTAMSEIEHKEDLLETSQRIIQKQEKEILDFHDELCLTEKENRLLRKSMDLMHEDVDISKDFFSVEREKLMKKLIEVEMDGQAAAQQVRELRETVRRIREESRPSAEGAKLTKQKELLLEKLTDFEATNRTLRRLLREQHSQEASALRLSEQRDVLIKKMADMDRLTERLRLELLERDRLIVDLRNQTAAQREENMALSGLQGTLEGTRAHLQKQLRTKEADCNRMAVQIRSLESQVNQDKIELDHIQDLLNNAKGKSDRDKDALKKATRAQKQRAERSEDALDCLNAQLMERETQVADLKSDLDHVTINIEKISKERAQAQAENTALKTRISELEYLVDKVEESARSNSDTVTVRLHEKTSEVSNLKLENERLKSSIANIESKFQLAEEEMLQLRNNLRQSEKLTDDYRDQIEYVLQRTRYLKSMALNRSRREADEISVHLEVKEKENGRLHQEGELELEKVKLRLNQRLQELEPLPELLRTTEFKLQDATDQLLAYERKNTDNTKLIAELTAKVEQLTDTMDQIRGKMHGGQDENRTLASRVELMDKKLKEVEDQNRELITTIAKREESIHQNNLRLEEKTRENGSLTRQLENALTDIRRHQDQARDRMSSKERTYQSRIADLESQLSQLRAEIARVKREKEENERKFNSRMYDLKDRLEQSHSTNRSMQNYVQFLKNSYANVFGDSAISMPTSPIRSIVP